MSDSGESYTLSDTGESRTTSEAGDSSVLSDWSMVDSHGELPDDETTSTSSSVEVVDDADDEEGNIEPVTPVAGSPSVITPRFILRLPSHNQDGSDTDEDKQEHVTGSGVSDQVTMDTPAHMKAGQSFRQSPPETRISREQLEEFRQTIDHLKKNLLPSQEEDNSVSSIDLFGDGKPDTTTLKTDSSQPDERTVENTGIHGNLLDENLSLDSSVSSSYSFLSRDAGTDCLLLGGTSSSIDGPNGTGNHPDIDKEDTSEPEEMQGTSELTCTFETETHQEPSDQEPLDQEPLEADTKQEVDNKDHQSGTENGLKKFLSQFLEYPVKYIFLAGLVAYTGVVIVAVYSIYSQGQSGSKELDVLHQCYREREEMQIKLDTCDKDIQDSKVLIKSTDQKLELLRKEKNEISIQLEKKEKEANNLNDDVNTLMTENKRITKADGDLQERQRELQGEIETLQSQMVQSASDSASTKQSLEKCLKDIEEVKQQKDADNLKYNADKEYSSVQKQCQTDISNIRNHYQSEINSIRKQYQSDLDHVRIQYQSDLDKVRKDYQSKIDTLTMHMSAKNKYMQSENTADKICDEMGNQCTNIDSDEEGDGFHGEESHYTNSKSSQQSSNYREKKHSGRTSGGNTNNADKNGDNSDEYKSKERNSAGSYWAEKVLDIMNKTREHIQDTWTKVKDMSENIWQEHQPTLYRLHDSFTKKFQHLSKRFQNKLAKKLKRWFCKGKRYTQEWYNGQQANTKRRPYKTEDDVLSSNRSIEDRLVKLSHQVQTLNAKRFRKWKDTPKVLDIQEEVNQVDILVNKGDEIEKSKLTDWYLKWLSCQVQWWKSLNVPMVIEDCYLSLCCWQVKVTGGNAKQCRKLKRRQGMVEDSCTLEHLDQTRASNGKNQNSKYGPANNEDKTKYQGATSVQDNHDGNVDKEPASSRVDNWFLARGEDREYYREEPDNWFFRRQNQEIEQTRKIHETDELYEEHHDDDDNELYYNDEVDDDYDEFCGSHEYDCSSEFLAGHCGCP